MLSLFIRTRSSGNEAPPCAASLNGHVSPAPLCSRTYLGPPLLIQLHRHEGWRALLTHSWLPALPEEVDTLLFASHPNWMLSLLSTSHCKHTEPWSGSTAEKPQGKQMHGSLLQALWEHTVKKQLLGMGLRRNHSCREWQSYHMLERKTTFLPVSWAWHSKLGKNGLQGPLDTLRKTPASLEEGSRSLRVCDREMVAAADACSRLHHPLAKV